MEYAKENVLKLGTFNTEVERLNKKKEKRTSKIFKIIKKHKFISTVIGLFFLLLIMFYFFYHLAELYLHFSLSLLY